MQAQNTTRLVPIRAITLAFALLVALLLASAAGYAIRGAATAVPAGGTVVVAAPVHGGMSPDTQDRLDAVRKANMYPGPDARERDDTYRAQLSESGR